MQASAAALVGFGSLFDKDDFFRDSWQVGYNITLSALAACATTSTPATSATRTPKHLLRNSNGWGSITVPGGRTSFQGTPIFYLAAFQQQGFGTAPPLINSEYRSQSIEVNDTINWKNWTFNVGLLAEQRHAVRPGAERRTSRRSSGYVRATALDVEVAPLPDARDPVQQDAAAAHQRDLGLQRQGHGLRQLRALQPRGRARCRAPPRGTATWRRRSRRTSTPTATCSRPTRTSRRPASCSWTT